MSKIESYKGTRKITSEGLILIPKDIRDAMEVGPGDLVTIEYRDGSLFISNPSQKEIEADPNQQTIIVDGHELKIKPDSKWMNEQRP